MRYTASSVPNIGLYLQCDLVCQSRRWCDVTRINVAMKVFYPDYAWLVDYMQRVSCSIKCDAIHHYTGFNWKHFTITALLPPVLMEVNNETNASSNFVFWTKWNCFMWVYSNTTTRHKGMKTSKLHMKPWKVSLLWIRTDFGDKIVRVSIRILLNFQGVWHMISWKNIHHFPKNKIFKPLSNPVV